MTICRDLEWGGEEVAVVIPFEVTVMHPFLPAAYSSLSVLKIKVLITSEMLIINCQSARHHIPDDHNLCLVCTHIKCKDELAITRLKSYALKLI